MKKIILTLVFVMGIMGLSAVARADTPDWMNPDSPLALGLHPRLLFIPDEYRAAHPDAVGLTVKEMRDKLISHPEYVAEFKEFITAMDTAFNEDITKKTKMYATYDAVNYAFLYVIDPTIMREQAPYNSYNFVFGHTKDEYGDKAIEHAVYIATQAKMVTAQDKAKLSNQLCWIDHFSYDYSSQTIPGKGITNISLAIVNDWVNERISKIQRQLFMDGIINTYNLREPQVDPLTSERHYGHGQNGDAGALGFYLDDIDNVGQTTYQNCLTTFLNALNADWLKGFVDFSELFFGEGGSNNPQGIGYNRMGIKNMISFIHVLSTALNENYFNSISYLREYTPYEVYQVEPRLIQETYSTKYYYFGTDDIGRELVQTEWGKYQIISNSMIHNLSKTKPENASLMKWFVNDSGFFVNNNIKNSRFYYVFYHFFMGNKDVISKSPTQLNLPKSRNLGMGHYVMRTGFTNPDDSVVMFFAPKYYTNDGGHAHRKFAAFEIYKYGNLAIKRQIAKDFAGGNYRETRCNMFYNTIGVYKHGENSLGGSINILNLMGYRGGYNDHATDPNDPAFAENGKNHVGTVKKDDLNGVDYDYIDYEYSNCWTPSYLYEQKVDYSEREFVYLRPSGGTNDEYVVVFDRLNSLDPSYTKYWLLHASFEPKLIDSNNNEIIMTPEDYPNDGDGIGGGRWVNKSSSPTSNNIIEITNTWGTDNGNNGINTNKSHGRLYNKTLLPDNFQINKTGGPGHYWEDAEGKLIRTKDLTEMEKNDRGTYTMQVQSTTNQTYDHFLNVIQFGDSNTLAQMNPVTRIDGDAMVGAFIDDPHSPRVVLFSQDQKGASVQSVRYKVNYFAALTGKHLLADMEPGKYDVYKNGVKIHSDLSALDKKGTLYFEANGDSSEEESKESLFEVVRTGEIPAPIIITGDINADGIVNVLDVQLCVNVVLGISPPFAVSPLPNWAWDADKNGKIDGDDMDEMEAVIVERAKTAVNPLDECNVLDLQAVVNVILNSV